MAGIQQWYAPGASVLYCRDMPGPVHTPSSVVHRHVLSTIMWVWRCGRCCLHPWRCARCCLVWRCARRCLYPSDGVHGAVYPSDGVPGAVSIRLTVCTAPSIRLTVCPALSLSVWRCARRRLSVWRCARRCIYPSDGVHGAVYPSDGVPGAVSIRLTVCPALYLSVWRCARRRLSVWRCARRCIYPSDGVHGAVYPSDGVHGAVSLQAVCSSIPPGSRRSSRPRRETPATATTRWCWPPSSSSTWCRCWPAWQSAAAACEAEPCSSGQPLSDGVAVWCRSRASPDWDSDNGESQILVVWRSIASRVEDVMW